ncbi:MAG: hypothetical protein KDA20_09290 [Phycisphaerales bacterium]|nr:hypothetical protein [Phycisphaerales bacterium]
MFALDRDLLLYEPGLFREVAWAGQMLVRNEACSVSANGTTVTIAGADLQALSVQPGMVAQLSTLGACEVTSVIAATQMNVSRLRARLSDDPLPITTSTTSDNVTIQTFTPQIALIHDVLLASLGLVADDAIGAAGDVSTGAVEERQVLNARELAPLEALGALHLVYASAAPLAGPNSILWTKAEMYRDRFARAKARAAAAIDLDGDGVVDAVRQASVVRFQRG